MYLSENLKVWIKPFANQSEALKIPTIFSVSNYLVDTKRKRSAFFPKKKSC